MLDVVTITVASLNWWCVVAATVAAPHGRPQKPASAHGEEQSRADRPNGDMARDQQSWWQVEPHVTGMGELLQLVALHSDFDVLGAAFRLARQEFRINEDRDAARRPWLPCDEAGSFQRQHHLVNGRRADAEIFLDVGFGRGSAVQARIEVDIGQILALPGREGFCRRTYVGHPTQLSVRASNTEARHECTLSGRSQPSSAPN